MEIKDRVYGTVSITEPVLLELIDSAPVQRLKRINQAGASQYVIEGLNVTRYEHSVGVMILLRKLGASIEEQTAGLLHDVPHTAFSHVIDHVFTENNHDHEFHERFHEQIIMQSEVPAILEKHGFSVERLLDEKNFLLLERSSPDLCADRIDYALRDCLAIGGSQETINEIAAALTVKDNEIIMSNKETAQLFAEEFLRMDTELWADPRGVTIFEILADALRRALDKNILTEDDLFLDDATVFAKLQDAQDKHITERLAMLNPNLEIEENPEDFDFYGKTKPRYIDPKFVQGEKVLRVSDVDNQFLERVAAHKNKVLRGVHAKVIASSH